MCALQSKSLRARLDCLQPRGAQAPAASTKDWAPIPATATPHCQPRTCQRLPTTQSVRAATSQRWTEGDTVTLGEEGGGQRCRCPVPGWPRGGAHPSRPHGAPAGFPEPDALEAAPDRADTAPGTSVPGGYPTPAPPPQSPLPLGCAGTHGRPPVPPPARAVTQPEATVGPEEGTWRGAGCVGPVHTRLENEQAGVPMVTGDSGQQVGQVWEGGLLEPLHRCQSPGTALESTPPSLPLPSSSRPPGPAACLGHPGTAEEAPGSVLAGWVPLQTWPHPRRSHGPAARCSPVRG